MGTYVPVLLVLDYWDQPRSGISTLYGDPIRFRCLFNEDQDSYSNTYLIKPITCASLDLEREAFELYYRHTSTPEWPKLLPEGHPVFPEAKPRHDEIIESLQDDRHSFDEGCDRLEGCFRRRSNIDSSVIRPDTRLWEVRWAECPIS